jgi:GntR family transcriptional regulator
MQKDREHPMQRTPKYFKISQDIIRRISGGELLPGMRVPSENQIIAAYEVSNTTARKALLEIERSGWAVRIKGRGTLVRSGPVTRSADRILSFTKNMIEAGVAPSTKVLYQGIIDQGYGTVINGRRYTMKGPICKIHRLRFGGGVPMMLEVRYISLDLCPGIETKALDRSLYDLYEKEYGLRLTEVHQMLSAIMLDAGTREFFDIRDPIPGFLVDGVTFCGKDLILEMEKSVYRGDTYRFAIRAI